MEAGNAHARWLLIEVAWRIMRSRSEETVTLQAWASGIATHCSKRVAVVALARRLARILYAMWRDGARYNGGKVRAPRPQAAIVA